MTDRYTTPILLELKRSSVDISGVFSGYASTFGGPPDSVGDVMNRGAFRNVLLQHKSADTVPGMFWAHDHREVVGKWLTLKEDSTGLQVTGRLTLGTQRGAEAYALLQDDALALSIGFAAAKDGVRRVGNIRHITKVAVLQEISLVGVPANTRARVTSVKGKPTTPREFEHQLRSELGLSVREAKRACAGGWGALVRDVQGTDLDQVLSEIQSLRTELNEVKS